MLVLGWLAYAFVFGAIVGAWAYGSRHVAILRARNARLLAELELARDELAMRAIGR